MNQKPKDYNALEMGLTSITGMLSTIAISADNTNGLLKSLSNDFNNFSVMVESSITQLLSEGLQKAKSVGSNTSLKIVDYLQSINDTLFDMLYFGINSINQKASSETIASLNIFSNIDKTLTSIYDFLLGTSLNSVKNINAQNVSKEGIPTNKKSKNKSLNLNDLSKSLSGGLNKQMEDFGTMFDRMITVDDKKFDKFNKTVKLIDNFGDMMESLHDRVKSARNAMFGFTFGTVLLTMSLGALATALPVILLLLWGFKKIFVDVASSLGYLLLGMAALTFVDFGKLIKITGFVIALGIVLSFVMKSNTGMFGTSGGRTGKAPSIVSFAFSLALVVLALNGLNDVPFNGFLALITFIALLGMELFSFKKLGGMSTIYGLPSIALGLGLMVLAAFAFNDVPLKGMFLLLAFIGMLGLELVLFNKLGGTGKMSGLPGIAFGVGLLTIAMWVMADIEWETVFKMVAFIGMLGIVLKLFTAKSGLSMLLLSGGILILTGALILFKKSGFGITDSLSFAGSVLIVGSTVALLGTIISPVAVLILLGVTALSASILLLAGSLFLISKLDYNAENILKFLGSVTLLTIGFSLLVVPLVPAAIGAVLFIPVAVSALLGGISLLAISNLDFNLLNIWNFVKSITLVTLGFAFIAIPAVIGLVGALAFIPIAVSALLGAGSLFLISKIKIDNLQISSFMQSVKILAVGFGEITLWAAVGAAGALLFLPIATSALVGAKALSLISKTTINQKNIDDFKFGMKGLVDTFNSFGILELTKVSAKSVLLLPLVKVAASMIESFSKFGTFDSKKATDDLLLLTDTLNNIFKRFAEWNIETTTKSINVINSFGNSINSLKVDNFDKLNASFSRFVDVMSDEDKWGRINNNLAGMSKNVKQLITSINMLNLSKAKALENNLTLLSNKSSSENLTEVIKKLKEMIGLLTENQQKQLAAIESKNTQLTSGTVQQSVSTDSKKIAQANNVSIGGEITDALNSLLDKLDGVLTVAIVDGNSNKLR